MSVENWYHFNATKMYRNISDPTVNMEYLFNMTNPNVGGEDPPANPDPLGNSLFNLTTLKTLINLGMNTPIILSHADKDKVYGRDFDLNDWTDIAKTLELIDSNDSDGLIIG